MVVALWRRRNRCLAAMDVEPLRRRPLLGVFRHRFGGGDLLGQATAGFAFRQRRHGRAGGAGRDLRLALLVAAAETDIGEPMQQRRPALLRMVLLVMGPADLGL